MNRLQTRKSICHKKHSRRGLSLLEVVLAIAIMGSAMIIIGNLVSLGSNSAGVTKWRSDAQILCNAKMAEISAGVLPLESVSGAGIQENPLAALFANGKTTKRRNKPEGLFRR